MISTGIKKIDEYLEGGIRRGSIALLNSDPGIDLVKFQLHTILSQKNMKILYIVNNKKPELVCDTHSRHEIENVYILDCFSPLLSLSSGFDSIKDPHNTENIYKKICSLIEEQCFDIVVFDSLTMLYDQTDAKTTHKFIKKISDLAECYEFVPVFLFTSWYGVYTKLRDLFDYIIDLKLPHKKLVGCEMINIAKVRGKLTETNNIPYTMIDTGISI